MADSDTEPPEAESAEEPVVDETEPEVEGDGDAESEVEGDREPEFAREAEQETTEDVGRTDLKVIQARKSLEEEAEAARRRVLGSRRGRLGPATLTAPAPTDDNV